MSAATEEPAEVAAQVRAMEARGWARTDVSATLTGRSVLELAMLWESGEAPIEQVGAWWSEGVPRTVYMVQLDELRRAPRRAPLRLVT